MTISVPGDSPDWLPGGGGADLLVPYQSYSLDQPANSITFTIDVLKSYQSLVIAILPAPGEGGVFLLGVECYDATGNKYYVGNYTYSISSLYYLYKTLPMPATASGSVQIAILAPSSGMTATIVAYGLIPPLASTNQPVRSDGRPYPVGSKAAHGESLTSYDLIAAPGAGSRIIIATLSGMWVGSANGGIGVVQGIIGGVTFDLLGMAAPDSYTYSIPNAIPTSGVLLDDNTAVTVIPTAQPMVCRASATYDIVN